MDAIPLIIPVFNRPEWTKACLDALVDPCSFSLPVVPVLVDNGCRPKTSSLLSNWMAEWSSAGGAGKVVRRETNGGFAAGVNAGLQSIMGETSFKSVCVMHNDCVPFPGWLAEMSSILEGDDDIGLVMPRTNYANEWSMCIPELRKKYEALKPPNKDRLSPEEVSALVEATCGADRKAFVASLAEQPVRASYSTEVSSFCMLVRMELFQKYGKFDEDFWPRGFEDKFFWQPIERDGYVAMVANHVFVFHGGNITSDGPSMCFPEIMKMNEEKFRRKCEERDRTMAQKLKSQSGTAAGSVGAKV